MMLRRPALDKPGGACHTWFMRMPPTPILAIRVACAAMLSSTIPAPVACAATIVQAGAQTVVTPTASTNVLINPGKGWVVYGTNPAAVPALIPFGATGYDRFHWSAIEPKEGDYKWGRIDDAIAAWGKLGRQFAFGVMCASTHSSKDKPFVTPEWVFEAGAKYHEIDLAPKEPTSGTPGRKIAPVFDDPVFLAKLGRFIAALGKRYDGNPSIAFVDIRSYGNWGEGHMGGFKVPDIKPAKFDEHLAMHLAAFKKTRLVIPWGSRTFDPNYDRMVQQGMGIRRDGICGNSKGSETARCLGIAPAVFEFFGAYDWMKEKGWWEGRKDATGRGYSLATCVTNGAPSYIGPLNQGAGGTRMLAAERPMIEDLANRMGYHFVLKEARFSTSLRRGAMTDLDLCWENRGVAPIYIPAAVSFALVASDGRVIDTSPARVSKPAEWKPGAALPLRDSICFRRAAAGNHQLAVGILRPGDTNAPSIRIGIATPMAEGWHILAPVSVR